MPNINLLQALTSATSSTFLVVSDQGVARRLNFAGISSQIEKNFTTGVRTDQNLYTTSTVRFVGETLRAQAGSLYVLPAESVGYAFDYYHGTDRQNPVAIKQFDTLGSIRFGGYDGVQNLALDRKTSAVEFFAYADEDFEATANTVTNAGASWSISQQAPGLRLDPLSKQRVISSNWRYRTGLADAAGNPTPPSLNLIIGSGIGPTTSTNTPTLVNDLGTQRYKGFGPSLITFLHSEINQVGVTPEDLAFFYGSITDDVLTVTEITTGTNNRYGTISNGQTLQTVANLTSTNIVFNTEIVNQISGTPGGTGTYRVSILQTVPTCYMASGSDNNSLHNSFRYTFNMSRRSAVQGRRNSVKAGDTLGEILFIGMDEDNSSAYQRGQTAIIRTKATQNFTTSSHGSVMEFLTTPIDTFLPRTLPSIRLSLAYGNNAYYSNNHDFFDNSGNLNPPLHVGDWTSAGASFYANAVTISPNFQVGTTFYSGTTGTIAIVNGAIRFPDGTTQATAFNGTTSTNVTTIINQPAFRQVSKPVNATAPGTPGDIFFSNTFIYLCVDTNTWKKIAIATGGLW
jgi:hypothetical protein